MTQATAQPPAKPPTNTARLLAATITVDWERILYVAFVLLAILSRFWDLGSRVVSHDESLHTQYAYQFYIGDGYQHTPLMHGPFLFHITAVSYWLFGDSDLSARIPVALLGVLLVAMPFFCAAGWGAQARSSPAFSFSSPPI